MVLKSNFHIKNTNSTTSSINSVDKKIVLSQSIGAVREKPKANSPDTVYIDIVNNDKDNEIDMGFSTKVSECTDYHLSETRHGSNIKNIGTSSNSTLTKLSYFCVLVRE